MIRVTGDLTIKSTAKEVVIKVTLPSLGPA
jgi:polyisoprenoid-binding protein YceI